MHPLPRRLIQLIALILLAVAGCTRNAPVVPAPTPSPFQLRASIKEIMDAEVDPAADALWESVGTTVTAAGREDKQPRTPEEWQALRRSAITLIEATNLIVMDGRRIAPADAARVAGEPSTAVLQQRLDTNRAAFVGFAQTLRQVSLKTLAAIDAKDPERLFDAGAEIDEACEACHLVFWYPPEQP